ncbi:hypothetical protein [Phormidesmis priestleyi]
MSNCPCCSDQLLRHVKRGSLSWFCRTCWAEMPNFDDLRLQTPYPVKADFTDSLSQPILKVTLRTYRLSDPQDVAA